MALKCTYGRVLRDKAALDKDLDAIFVLDFLSARDTPLRDLRMRQMLAKIGVRKWYELKLEKPQLGLHDYYLALYYAVKNCEPMLSPHPGLSQGSRPKPYLRLIICSDL